MNIKHISLAISAVAIASLIAACTKNQIDDSAINTGSAGLNGQLVDLELASVSSTGTKAVIEGTEFPQTGEIGLFLFKNETATQAYGDGYKNIKYSYDSDKKKWTASPSIKVGSTPGYLYGYYPYNSGNTDITAIPVSSSLNGNDVMYASKQAEPITDATAANTAITMNHAMARVSITVKNNGYIGDAKLTSIKFEGAKTAQTGTLNAIDGSITASKSNVTLEVPSDDQTITKTGTTYECLLVPSGVETNKQTVTLTLTIDGDPKTATLSNNNGVIIAKGTKSNITITLSNTGITVQTVSVDDWNVVEVGGHKVTVKLSDDSGIADDVVLQAKPVGNSVKISAVSRTKKELSCSRSDIGIIPSISADTFYDFSIDNVSTDIIATVSYFRKTAAQEFTTVNGHKVTVSVAGGAENDIVKSVRLIDEKVIIEANAVSDLPLMCTLTGTAEVSKSNLSHNFTFTISNISSNIEAVVDYSPLVTLTVTSDSNGKVWIGDDKNKTTGQFGQGEQVVLHAAPNNNFNLFRWNDNNKESSRTITIGATNVTYSAKFIHKDAIPSLFTVDSNGKQVFFSKGNLYYNGTTFNFESNQYDTTPSSGGARVEDHISHFLWCDDATNAMSLKYNDNWNGETSFFAAKDFTVNGYSGWSVLTGGDNGEWEYLLDKRNTAYGSNHRYAAVKVNGMAGLLIFPDDFSSWPSKDAGTEPQTFNTHSNNWNGKNYSAAEFTVLQNNGCVFLPAAGFRNGNDGLANADFVGDEGYYWSASPNNFSYAYDLSFESGDVNPSQGDARNRGRSVRLVTE